MDEMVIYITDKNGVMKQSFVSAIPSPDFEINLLKLYPEVTYQEIIGFGGAFTEAAAYVWSQLEEKDREEVLEAYFGENGNRYNFGRTHIQSCDFSLGNRAYVEDGDDSLASFSVRDDYQWQIPFIKAALAKRPDMEFLASPWSPPAFMKSNHDMNHGGRLKKEYYDKWAEMMANYLLAYEREGIRIRRVTVQNEPAACQTWDSCLYSGTEEGQFAAEALRPALDRAGLKDVRILIWDHNKDIMLERAEETFRVSKAWEAADGIAFHWYAGDHFEALAEVGRRWPGKELIFTEGCVEYSRFAADQTANAEMYAHDMIGNFLAGTNGYLDWNLLLDEKGGPNHVGNYCDAPVMCDTQSHKIKKNLSYYYIGHFSRFVRPGARRILISGSNADTERTAFRNPDGSCAAVILNRRDEEQAVTITCKEKSYQVKIPEHAIVTACLERGE